MQAKLAISINLIYRLGSTELNPQQKETSQMKFIKTIVVACAFGAMSAYAVEPVKSEISCDQLGEQYVATAEALERFADLEGSCEGVYDIGGKMYVRSQAVIRQIRGNLVTLYLPATNHTFSVKAASDGRVLVGNRKMRVRDMSGGDEIGIYLSVDKFAEEKVDEIAFAAPDEAVEEIVIVEIEEVEVAALPTTG
jgi:hypothetical protein